MSLILLTINCLHIDLFIVVFSYMHAVYYKWALTDNIGKIFFEDFLTSTVYNFFEIQLFFKLK